MGGDIVYLVGSIRMILLEHDSSEHLLIIETGRTHITPTAKPANLVHSNGTRSQSAK